MSPEVVALVLTALIQTGAALKIANLLKGRLADTEARVENHEVRIVILETKAA